MVDRMKSPYETPSRQYLFQKVRVAAGFCRTHTSTLAVKGSMCEVCHRKNLASANEYYRRKREAMGHTVKQYKKKK